MILEGKRMNLKKAFVLVLLFCFCASLSVTANDEKEPINWRRFKPFCPTIQGWNKTGDFKGATMLSTINMSQGSQDYVAGKKKLTILFVDSVGDLMILAPIKSMLDLEVDTSTHYQKKITVEGYPGVVIYDFTNKTAEIIVLIASRIYIQISGKNIEEQAVDGLKAILELIDIAGIAELEK